MLEITVPDTSYSTQRVNINNTVYNLQLSFNSKDSAWYLDLFDINEVAILQSKKLQWGSSVTSRYILARFQSGALFVLNRDLRDEPITRNNFGEGKTFSLVWVSNEELELLNA